MKKRNVFAKKNNSSFLNLVKMITENVDDETEGLDFDDDEFDTEGEDFDAEGEDFDSEDDFGGEEDMVSFELPRSAAEQLYDALGVILGGDAGEEVSEDDFDADEDFGADEDFDMEDDVEADADADFDDEEEEEEEECDKEEDDMEEDEEVLGSNQSNVAQSTVSRNGAPKRSKASTTWNTGKTVKSVFDQTASGEGEPAGVSRDGAPKRSKFSKGWSNSKTVNSRLQPGKHAYEIGK